MKKIKAAILSVLLLSLCFVSFHDYMVTQDNVKEISCSEFHMEKEKALDSIVHDSLHHFLAHFDIERFSVYGLKNENPFFQQENLSSYRTTVLLRPPLS